MFLRDSIVSITSFFVFYVSRLTPVPRHYLMLRVVHPVVAQVVDLGLDMALALWH